MPKELLLLPVEVELLNELEEYIACRWLLERIKDAGDDGDADADGDGDDEGDNEDVVDDDDDDA